MSEPSGGGAGRVGRLLGALTRRRGDRRWDWIVRGTGLVGLAAIPPALVWPDVAALTGFFLLTAWVNGPLSPFLPAAYEPALMLFGRVYPPLAVAALGVLGIVCVEYLTYQMYRGILGLRALERVRGSRLAERVVAAFRRAPFLTVWTCALTPLPFWAVQILSPLSGYPVRRHLAATALGRLPRLWFFAALGTWWQVDAGWLLAAAAAGSAVVLAAWAVRAWRRRRRRRAGPQAPSTP